MSHRRYELLPEDDVIKVHACANFGSMTPRQVVDEGVLKAALGYHHGSTARAILLEHGLMREIGKHRTPGLTSEGARYLKALFPRQAVERLADLCDRPEGHSGRSLVLAFFGHDPGQEEQVRLWRAGLLRDPAKNTARPAPTAAGILEVRHALSRMHLDVAIGIGLQPSVEKDEMPGDETEPGL